MASSFESFEDHHPHQSPRARVGGPFDDDTNDNMGYDDSSHYGSTFTHDHDHNNLTVDPNNNNSFNDNNPHSPPVYGFGVSTPNPDYVSPFVDTNDDDDDGTFTSAGGGGGEPLLPDHIQMQEEGFARREWRRSDSFVPSHHLSFLFISYNLIYIRCVLCVFQLFYWLN